LLKNSETGPSKDADRAVTGAYRAATSAYRAATKGSGSSQQSRDFQGTGTLYFFKTSWFKLQKSMWMQELTLTSDTIPTTFGVHC
jgi:hypothetical protein